MEMSTSKGGSRLNRSEILKRKRSRNHRKIFRIFVSFAVCLSISVFSLTAIIFATLLNKGFVLRSFTDAEYYENIAYEITREYASAAIPSRMPEEFINEVAVVKSSDIYNDVNGMLAAAYSGREYNFDRVKLIKELEESFVLWAEENDFEINDADRKGVHDFAEYCIDEKYIRAVSLPLLTRITAYVAKWRSTILFVSFFCLILSAAISFLCFRRIKYPHHVHELHAYAFLGAGLTLLFFPAILLITGSHRRIAISPRSFYLFFNDLIQKFLSVLLLSGTILILVGVAFTLAYFLIRKRMLEHAYGEKDAMFRFFKTLSIKKSFK